jgi:hypothetical protein
MVEFPPATGGDDLDTDEAKHLHCRYVFTDVDNTIAGYMSTHMFPGAIRFLYELRGDMDDPVARLVAPKVMVLSARPDISWMAPEVDKHFVIGDDSFYGGTLHGKPVKDCLIQDLKHFHQDRADVAICRALARRKVCNMQEWLERHRGTGDEVIFVGDNGEGDSIAAQQMLSVGLIDYAFIRRVQPEDRVIFVGHTPTDTPFKNLFYFNDFSEAAQLAHEAGVISSEAYPRILDAFLEDSKVAGVLLAEEVPLRIRMMREQATQKIHRMGEKTPFQRWSNRCHVIPHRQRGRSHSPALSHCDARTDQEMHQSLQHNHHGAGSAQGARSVTPP